MLRVTGPFFPRILREGLTLSPRGTDARHPRRLRRRHHRRTLADSVVRCPCADQPRGRAVRDSGSDRVGWMHPDPRPGRHRDGAPGRGGGHQRPGNQQRDQHQLFPGRRPARRRGARAAPGAAGRRLPEARHRGGVPPPPPSDGTRPRPGHGHRGLAPGPPDREGATGPRQHAQLQRLRQHQLQFLRFGHRHREVRRLRRRDLPGQCRAVRWIYPERHRCRRRPVRESGLWPPRHRHDRLRLRIGPGWQRRRRHPADPQGQQAERQLQQLRHRGILLRG
jgi:hypothetical protein